MSFVKRTRIVSVRVTQDEYQTLDQISRRHGANSVSEFLRQLIMSSEPFASTARRAPREVAEELDDLKQKVDQLSRLVKQRAAKQSAPAALLDNKRP
jgi:hypothetical protein